MRRLIDFFNHGALPFVRRGGAQGALERFWNGTVEAHDLRAALILGEAGVGKSRLLEELTPGVAAAGGMVVHVKLYADTATSLAPLLARALRFSGAGRSLLRNDPEETIEGVTAALRRIARLRPTLLVIEDIHLLEEGATADFGAILEGIAHEPISLLCLARPRMLPVRPLLERYLVEEIELDGFTREELTELWTALFERAPDPRVVDILHRTTLGNALALRSGLRGILKRGAITRDDVLGVWEINVDLETLETMLGASVRLLSQGMAAHLEQRERDAAGMLASLGEVFARETALQLLGETRYLEILLFKGIIAQSAASGPPLHGRPTGAVPLAFTHTLVHRFFSGDAAAPADRLLEIVGSGSPIYSLLPFQMLGEGGVTAPASEVERVIHAIILTIRSLDPTPDWKLGLELLAAAERLFERYTGGWTPEQGRGIRITLLDARLLLTKRASYEETFVAGVRELLALTAEPLPENLLEYRIYALTYRHTIRAADERESSIKGELDDLVERHPGLRHTGGYVRALAAVATSRVPGGTDHGLAYVEPRLRDLLSNPDTPETIRRTALRTVAPLFLWSFHSQRELGSRLQLLAQIEATGEGDLITLRTRKAALFMGLGRMREALRMLDDVIPQLRDRGMLGNVLLCRVLRLYARAALGTPLPEIEAAFDRLLEQTPEPMLPRFRVSAGVRAIRIGLFRGDRAFAARMIERFPEAFPRLDRADHLLLAGSDEEALALLRADAVDNADRENPDDDSLLARAILAIRDAGDWSAEPLHAACVSDMLQREILTTTSIIGLSQMIRLVRIAGWPHASEGIGGGVANDLHDALTASLRWLAERELPACMLPLLEQHGALLDPAELKEWRARVAAMPVDASPEERPRNEHRLRIYMVGTIETEKPGEERVRIRGARLKTLLGLMTIDRMLKEPLSYREFCRVASGGEDDPERARKTMSMGVLRLREALGHDALLTAGDTPRLNPDLVVVDLLEADALLKEATHEIRRGIPVRAHAPLLRALELTRGEVPFPGLYDMFFEAAREEFEIRLRTAVIEVTERLLMEGDPASAEALLERAFGMMPEDDEIVGLFRRSLETQGKKLEAERVRIKALEAAL